LRIPRIYTNQELESHGTFQLDVKSAHYLSKVLRMQEGRPLVVFNGRGGEFPAHIKQISKQEVEIVCGEFNALSRMPELELSLAIGISRGEKMDWVIQKACELGVTRICPLFSERTEVKLSGERLQKKLNHWQQVAISASEQCQRNLLPEIKSPTAIHDYLQSAKAQLKLVLHHQADKSLKTIDKAMQESPSSVVLLVGPEGGLTQNEINLSLKREFQALRLGPRVLRTETAPLAALTLLQQLWGDLDT